MNINLAFLASRSCTVELMGGFVQ